VEKIESKYNSLAEWKGAQPSFYAAASRDGMLLEICETFGWGYNGRFTTEQFINRAIEVHDDKFDYSLADYQGSGSEVKIICPIHGVFEQNAAAHLAGRGCPKCTGRYKTTEEVIKEFREVHRDKFDYSLVDYQGSDFDVKIICLIHGVFEQRTDAHLRAKDCPRCLGRYKTTEDVIKEFREAHGDKFDYSLVDVVGVTKKVKIICPIHGVFEQTPNHHLKSKTGCLKCAGYGKTTEDVIKEFREAHGDKFDYSLVEYKNAKTKVKIICPTHGVFEQSFESHLKNKTGCPKCAGHGKTNEEVVKEFREVRGDKFDYSLVEYKNNKTKVKIICPIHGIFEQVPTLHLKNKTGCPKCAGHGKTNEEAIANVKKVHGDKFDYSLTEYVGVDYKIKIICPIHGIFEQYYSAHLNGFGCKKCAYENQKIKKSKKNKEEFIIKANEIHNKYDYSLVEYENAHIEVKIICPIHGVFEVKPTNHLRNKNGKCPKCNLL